MKVKLLCGEQNVMYVRPMTDADIEPSIQYLTEYIKDLLIQSKNDKGNIAASYIEDAQRIIDQLRQGRLINGRNPIVRCGTGHIVTDNLYLIYEDEINWWEEGKGGELLDKKKEVKKTKSSYSIDLPWKPRTKLYAVVEYADKPKYRIEETDIWSYCIDADGDVSIVVCYDEYYIPNENIFSNKAKAKSVAVAKNKRAGERPSERNCLF